MSSLYYNIRKCDQCRFRTVVSDKDFKCPDCSQTLCPECAKQHIKKKNNKCQDCSASICNNSKRCVGCLEKWWENPCAKITACT